MSVQKTKDVLYPSYLVFRRLWDGGGMSRAVVSGMALVLVVPVALFLLIVIWFICSTISMM